MTNGKWKGAAVVAVLASMLAAPAPAADLVLQGRIVDDTGLGLGGVEIHAFVGGFEKATGISGGDGSYTVTFPYRDDADQTILVWWMPVLEGQVPELALLKESSRDKQLGLWGPCIPRLNLQPSMAYDVTIHSEQTKFELLGQDDCLKAEMP